MIRWRFSLAYPILALVSFAALGVAIPLYLISVNSLKISIDSLELSKAKQVHHIAEAAIQNEIDKLIVLSKTLEKHRDLVDALKEHNKSGQVSAFSELVDPIVAKLDVGFAKIIDCDEQIIYRYNTVIAVEDNIWGVAEALHGQEIISTSRHPEGFAIRAIAPVYDENDKVLGAAVVGFIINNEFAERISSLTQTNIMIGSLKGVIASSEGFGNDQVHLHSNPALIDDKILESIKDDITTHSFICENDNLHFFKRLMIVDEIFSLVVDVDTSESQQLYTSTKRKITFTAGFAFMIAWLLGITLTWALIKPLQSLRDQSCHTVKQITGQSVEEQGGNELHALVSAFAVMRNSLLTFIDDLQRAQSELRQHKDHLEEIVAERTADLKGMIEKLNQSNKQLQEFTYVASHDLREPLRKISAFGQLLSASLLDKLKNDDRENLEFMIDGANRMQMIIEALLIYSRITTNGVEFVPVDLNAVVDELKSFELAIKIEETHSEVEVPEPLCCVNADLTQVRQLLQNLIANGLKYQKSENTPHIIIRSTVQDDGMVRVEVQDNGIGIEEDQYQNVFTMFRRLHTRQEYEGTGIGLAVCKKIVDRHGGEIGVASVYGEGSTFWFTMHAVASHKDGVLCSSEQYKTVNSTEQYGD